MIFLKYSVWFFLQRKIVTINYTYIFHQILLQEFNIKGNAKLLIMFIDKKNNNLFITLLNSDLLKYLYLFI